MFQSVWPCRTHCGDSVFDVALDPAFNTALYPFPQALPLHLKKKKKKKNLTVYNVI